MTSRNDPRVVSEWIEAVWKAGGTDLLLTADTAPLARVDGVYGPLNARVLTRDDCEMIVKRILTPDLYNVFVENLQVDFSFTWQEHARIRGNAFVQRGTPAIALRII